MLVSFSVLEGSTASKVLIIYGEHMTLSAFVENELVFTGFPVDWSISILATPLPLEAFEL